MLLIMLSKELYEIGKKYNLIVKYNIAYDKRSILDYICAAHINELLQERYPLNTEQKNKLTAIFNNLVAL